MTWPVVNGKFPRRMDEAALPTSSPEPHRANGTNWPSLRISSYLSFAPAVMSETIIPGFRSFTNIPWSANRVAHIWVAIDRPALERQYAPLLVDTVSAEIYDMLIIW